MQACRLAGLLQTKRHLSQPVLSRHRRVSDLFCIIHQDIEKIIIVLLYESRMPQLDRVRKRTWPCKQCDGERATYRRVFYELSLVHPPLLNPVGACSSRLQLCQLRNYATTRLGLAQMHGGYCSRKEAHFHIERRLSSRISLV